MDKWPNFSVSMEILLGHRLTVPQGIPKVTEPQLPRAITRSLINTLLFLLPPEINSQVKFQHSTSLLRCCFQGHSKLNTENQSLPEKQSHCQSEN